VHALVDANKFDSVRIPLRQMQDLFVDPWQRSTSDSPDDLSPYLIVIDALDEVEDRGGLTFLHALLTTIQKGNLQGLKFLVTSWEDNNVASLCEGFSSDVVCHLHKVAEEDVSADILRYLDAELPCLDKGEHAELAQQAGGLFIYAATAVRYMTPQDGLTRGEQLKLMRNLLGDSGDPKPWDPNEDPEEPLQVDILYHQIVSEAFGRLKKELCLPHLRFLYTLLCTKECVSVSVAARLLSDSSDMVECANQVVRDLHAVLYIMDGKVFWYHASFPDFIFTQARSQVPVSTVYSSISLQGVNVFCDPASHGEVFTLPPHSTWNPCGIHVIPCHSRWIPPTPYEICFG
jgi:hypothetical protein